MLNISAFSPHVQTEIFFATAFLKKPFSDTATFLFNRTFE